MLTTVANDCDLGNLDTGGNTTVRPWREQYMLELTVAS